VRKEAFTYHTPYATQSFCREAFGVHKSRRITMVNHQAISKKMVCEHKETPERGFLIVAQGSQCPERALVNPGITYEWHSTPEVGYFNESNNKQLKPPLRGCNHFLNLSQG